jgi:hypothetical protein
LRPVRQSKGAAPPTGNRDGMKILGVLLLVGGLAGVLYGHFTYIKATH